MNPRQSYREAAVAGASPVRLVILLYEQAIEDLRRAQSAHARGDIEGRTREINHALLVIGHLEGSLDKQAGGQVAENLERFYALLRSGLMRAQFEQSSDLLERQIEQLINVHEAWQQVERSEGPPPPASTVPISAGSEPKSHLDWKV